MVPGEQLAEATSLVREGQAQITALQQQLEQMVPQEAAEELRRTGEEMSAQVARLRGQLEGMVPRGRLEDAKEVAEVQGREMERLTQQMKGMVPRAELEAVRDEAGRLKVELERRRVLDAEAGASLGGLQREVLGLVAELGPMTVAMARMVPVEEMEAAASKVARHEATIRRLGEEKQRLDAELRDMVPRSEAEAAESQLALCRGETAALRAKLADQEAGMVVREAELRSKLADSERRTESMVGRMESMVPAGLLEDAQRELSRAAAESAGLRARLQGMVMASELRGR